MLPDPGIGSSISFVLGVRVNFHFFTLFIAVLEQNKERPCEGLPRRYHVVEVRAEFQLGSDPAVSVVVCDGNQGSKYRAVLLTQGPLVSDVSDLDPTQSPQTAKELLLRLTLFPQRRWLWPVPAAWLPALYAPLKQAQY